MKRFFIIGIDQTTKNQSEAFQNWLHEKNVSWWHWIDGVWLVVSRSPDLDASAIRNQIHTVAGRVHNIVVEIEPKSWAGTGPKSDKRSMFRWIRQNWKK